MKNLNLLFQLSTITAMLVAGMFTFAVAQNADEQSGKQKLTIDIEVIENGEITKITKEIDASEGESIHQILKDLDIMDDLDITGTGERLEIKVKKEIHGDVDTDIDVEVFGNGNQWHGKDAVAEKQPLLGVYPQSYDKDGRKGAQINQVVSGSAAEKAGLLEGDVILSINKTEIISDMQLREEVLSHEVGELITLKYLRNGKENSMEIPLGEYKQQHTFRRNQAQYGGNRFFFKGDPDSEEFQLHMKELEQLSNKLDLELDPNGPFLGVTSGECGPGENNGVQIGRVIEGSAAEKMGLQSGDRISKLDGKAVDSFDELADVISAKKAGDNLQVEYQRNGESISASGELGSRSETEKVERRMFNYNPHCDIGAGNGPWALDVIKEVSVVIEMKDCTAEEEEMLAAPAKVNFEEELALNRIEFSPNPNNGQFNLEFELPEQRDTRILVFDQMGRIVHEQLLGNFDGSYKDQIDISSQPNGVYFLIIAQGQKQFTRKIVKQ